MKPYPYRARRITVEVESKYTVPRGYNLVVESVKIVNGRKFMAGWLYPTSTI